MKIVMGSDHAGRELKLQLKEFIELKGHSVIDVGSNLSESVNYPVYGKLAAEKIINGEAELAVLVCGTGCGMSLAVNKVKGIRCVNCTEPCTAMLARKHNNANALALGARIVSSELAKMIVDTWLNARFLGGRHLKRVEMYED